MNSNISKVFIGDFNINKKRVFFFKFFRLFLYNFNSNLYLGRFLFFFFISIKGELGGGLVFVKYYIVLYSII